jgi:hypothetical protein
MASTINHLKKNESLINKQLCVIDSDYRKENENTSSFSNTLNKTEKRVCKLDIVDVTISNTIYNIDNSSVLLDINEELINGEIINKKIIVDDTEIKNNKIFSTNKINGDVDLYNYITSNNSSITDIKSQGLFIISTGLFNKTLIDYFNTDNFNSIKTINGVGLIGGFCACYNIDQSLKWVLRLVSNKMTKLMVDIDESHIYIYGYGKKISIVDINNKEFIADFGEYKSGIIIFKCTYAGVVELVIKYDVNYPTDNFYLTLSDYIYIIVENGRIGEGSNDQDANSILVFNKSGDILVTEPISSNRSLSPTSITIAPDNKTQIFIAFNFSDTITYPDGQKMVCKGNTNITIMEFEFDLIDSINYIGSVLIGGTATDKNCILKVLENKIYLTGNFTSNPIVFYNSNDKVDFVLTERTSNINIFIGSYPIDFIKNIKSIDYCFYVTSSTEITLVDLKCKDNIFISCNFKNNMKFNDINGYAQTNDIILTTDKQAQCIMSYSLDGSFRNRIYNTNSEKGSMIDINSSKLITYSNFTTNNSYYNVNSELSITLNTKDVFNCVIISFFNSDVGITVDYETFNKTLVCTSIDEYQIGFLLNINTFSENLGFEKSQKFLATSVGSLIPWDNIEITSENSILTLELQIANLKTLVFDTFVITFKISTALSKEVTYTTNYNPYNLIYILNKIFLSHKKNYTFLNQNIPAFYYDTDKKLFYIRLDIQGTFKVINTNLSTSMKLNLMTAPMCVISDIQVSNINDIVDNTKLILKLTDNTNTEIVNSVNFSEVFPLIKSNNLTIVADVDSTIYAYTEQITDKVSNINVGSNITFEYPYLTQPTFNYIDEKIKYSNSGKYVITWKNGIQKSDDYGNTWKSIDYFSNIIVIDADVSNDGYIYVIDSINLFVSDNFGYTFSIIESERSWENIKTSSNTGYVIAVTKKPFGNDVLISDDYGISWILFYRANSFLLNLQISHTGQYQLCYEYSFSDDLARSKDYGKTWDIIFADKLFDIITMSGDGNHAIVVSENIVYVCTDLQINVPIFTKMEKIGTISYTTIISVSMGYGGNHQAILADNKLLLSSDTGKTWKEIHISNTLIKTNYISMSGSGSWVAILATMQDPDPYKKSSVIYISNEYGNENTWSISKNYGSLSSFTTSCISFDGKYQCYGQENRTTIYISDDYGITINKVSSSLFNDRFPQSISISESGQYITCYAVLGDYSYTNIQISINYGIDWVSVLEILNGSEFVSSAISKTGQYQVGITAKSIFLSNNYGKSFSNVKDDLLLANTVCISASGEIIVISTPNDLWQSSDAGVTWVKTNNPPDTELRRCITISSDGVYRTILTKNTSAYITHYGIFTSNDSGLTWVYNNDMIDINVIQIEMDETGKYQVCCGVAGLYKSSNYGNGPWEFNKYINTNFTNTSISKNGLVSSVYNNYKLYINRFLFDRISLNVKLLNNTENEIKQIIFKENTNLTTYIKLNKFNLFNGLKFTVTSILNSPPINLYITPGDYNIDKFIEQVNNQIHEINPEFYYGVQSDQSSAESVIVTSKIEPFIFNSLTKKITFNPYYIGIKNNILIMTNLLKLMGFIELPNYIINKISGSDIVNSNILGIDRTNIYISSTIINNFMVENTSSINNKLNKVLATLRYSSEYDSYKLINSVKNEIFLSQKASIYEIDIKILNNRGKIVNLNGGNVNINFNLIKS